MSDRDDLSTSRARVPVPEKAPDDSPSWSLAARLRRLFLGTTLLFVVGVSLASGVYLWTSVRVRVDALAVEETEEISAAYDLSPFSLEHFKDQIEEEQRRHPEHPMAWRLWLRENDPPMDFGEVRLLQTFAPTRDVLEVTEGGWHCLRRRTTSLHDGTRIGLVVDGTNDYGRLALYCTIVLVLVAGTFWTTFLVSRQVFTRMSDILHTVAERTRLARTEPDSRSIQVEGAPEEIREVADALTETLNRIRAEAQDMRVFTAGIAHELRSPVQNLIGETEVALIAQRDAGVYRGVLSSHLDELRRLGDAIDNLVTICSRNETQRTAARESFDLESEARMRLQREKNLAERSQLEFVFRSEGDTRIVGDREAVLRAVRNLTQNAIQWSPAGGKVVVAIRGDDGHVTVTVDDQGPGVPVELRQQIFEPFFRGPSAQGRRIGYGLGLALTRSAAIEQGGDVTVETSPMGGARFRLVLEKRLSGRADDLAHA